MDDATWYAKTHKQIAAWANTMGMAFAGGAKAFQAANDFVETAKHVHKEEAEDPKKEPRASDWITESRRRLRLTKHFFKPAEVKRIGMFLDQQGRS